MTCEILQLQKPDDISVMLPVDLQDMTSASKKSWLEKKVSPIIDKIMCTYSAPHDTQVVIEHKGSSYHVTIPAENAGKTIQLQLNGNLSSEA